MKKIFLLCLPFVFSSADLWAANFWAAKNKPPVPLGLPSEVLTGEKREHYLHVFNEVIETYKDEKPYKWRSGTANGSILLSKEFLSKDYALCRSFSESYMIDSKIGQAQGIVCRKEDKTGWCRLTYEDARTCNPKKPEDPAAATDTEAPPAEEGE